MSFAFDGLGVGDYIEYTRTVLEKIRGFTVSESEMKEHWTKLSLVISGAQTYLESAKRLQAKDDLKQTVEKENGDEESNLPVYQRARNRLLFWLKKAEALHPKEKKSIFKNKGSTKEEIQKCIDEIFVASELLDSAITFREHELHVQARTKMEEKTSSPAQTGVKRNAPDNSSSDEKNTHTETLKLDAVKKTLNCLRQLEKIADPVLKELFESMMAKRETYRLHCIVLEGRYANFNKVKRNICASITLMESEDEKTALGNPQKLQAKSDPDCFEACKQEFTKEAKVNLKSKDIEDIRNKFDTLVAAEKSLRVKELELEALMQKLDDTIANMMLLDIPEDEANHRHHIENRFKALKGHVMLSLASLKTLYTNLSNPDNQEEKAIETVFQLRNTLNKKAVRMANEFIETVKFYRDLFKVAFIFQLIEAKKTTSHEQHRSIIDETSSSSPVNENGKRLKYDDHLTSAENVMASAKSHAVDLAKLGS